MSRETGVSADADRATHEPSPQAVSPVPASIPSAGVGAWGPINGMGEDDPAGSYVRLSITHGEKVRRFKISVGGAEVLASELIGSLGRRSLRSRIKTVSGEPVVETDAEIACALRWYRRRGTRAALMVRIDELEAQAIAHAKGQAH